MKLYLRKEFFGSIIYCPNTAQYFNLNHLQTQQLSDFITGKQNTAGAALFSLISPHSSLPPFPSLMMVKTTRGSLNRLSVPLKAFFNITKKCNLFCRHCYNDSGHLNSPELSFEDIARTLQELETRGIFKITIAGGEPLFHPEFDRIVDCWNNSALAISLITNGICLSKRRANHLAKSANVRSITISLDGATAESNDAVRGEGAFIKTLRGIEHLRQYYDRSLAVRITIMRSNLKNVEQLPSLVAKLGIDEIKVNSINAYGRAQCASDLLISPEEYLAARQRLFDNATLHGITVEVPAHKYQRDENDQIGLCRAGEETFEIDGDGSVYPCSFSFGRFLAGNLRYTSFDEIFRNLQLHSINNEWCYQCKGRGGKAEKVFGSIPRLIEKVCINPS